MANSPCYAERRVSGGHDENVNFKSLFFMLKHRLHRNAKREQVHSQMGCLCLHIVFLRTIDLVLKVILWGWGDLFFPDSE